MRILFFAHGFPPQALGGTEIYTHGLAHAMRDSFDDEVSVVTRESDPKAPEYRTRLQDDDGIKVFLINNTFSRCRSFAETYKNPAIHSAVSRILDQTRPDVAHIQHLTCLSTRIVAELHRRHIPTLYTLNDYWLMCHRGQLLDRELRRCEGPHRGCDPCIQPHAGFEGSGFAVAAAVSSRLRRLPKGLAGPLRGFAERLVPIVTRRRVAADAGHERTRHMLDLAGRITLFLAPSFTLRNHFLRFGIAEDRIRHIHQGIDHSPLQDIDRQPADHLRIGFLGSMMASKAPHLLLEAFAGLPQGVASLEIFGGFADYHGDGTYRQRVEPLLRGPGIHHHGPVPHNEVATIFARIDVLVVPSIWLENAPFVIREAFIAGTPPIVTDHGGMAEMVRHDIDGLRFKPGDSGSLRDSLSRCIKEPELVDRLRRGAPDVLTIQEDAAQIRTIYDDVRAKPATPVPPHRMATVVLNYRTPQDTVLAVRSLQTCRPTLDNIIVVDNHSPDRSAAYLKEHTRDCEIIKTQQNLGFSGGCNVGIRRALELGAESVLLINGDVAVASTAPGLLRSALEEDETLGIAGPLILSRKDPSRIDSAGVNFHRLSGRMRHRHAGEYNRPGLVGDRDRVAAVMGCAMLIDRKVIESVGFFDEDFFFSFEDLEYCLRARNAGFGSVVVRDAVVYHAGSLSIGPQSPDRLYYACRNHLLAAGRAAPLPFPFSFGRSLFILGFNLAFAARSGWVSITRGFRASLRGAWHHLRRRYGKAPL